VFSCAERRGVRHALSVALPRAARIEPWSQIMTSIFTARRSLTGLALAAVGVAALSALPAAAQPYDPYDTGYASGEIVVQPPRTLGRSAIGAPIRLVTAQRVVRFDDLDLASYDGRQALRHRIQSAARDACDYLDARYPVTDENSPDCYSTAVRDAMLQAEDLTGYAVASR
jgi:UrcA family protein